MGQNAGWFDTLSDLVGAFMPMAARRLEIEIEDRVAKLPTQLNEYGYDDYGLHTGFLRTAALPTAVLYRSYFRAECHDIDRVPEGRVLLVANHAGQLPLDGMMLWAAMLLQADPPRIPRAMAEYWVSELPWVNVLAARAGALVGTPENCTSMLEAGECVMVFPEGVRGLNKPYSQRYRLQSFGEGFMRLALATDTPVVPVGIVGSEEQAPAIANLSAVANALGMPAFPITPTFPLLGPLGLLPLPVKYHLHFGEPMRFSGDPAEDDSAIGARVEQVRSALSGLLERGLQARKGIFRS